MPRHHIYVRETLLLARLLRTERFSNKDVVSTPKKSPGSGGLTTDPGRDPDKSPHEPLLMKGRESLHNTRVKMSAGTFLEATDRLGIGHSRAVHAVARHRFKRVRNGDNPGQ